MPISGSLTYASVNPVRNAKTWDERCERTVNMPIRPGEIQLVNNNVIVHARAVYVDTDRVRRELLRIWLNLFDSPVPPAGDAAHDTVRSAVPHGIS